jgi:hypothetical protein
MDLSYGKWVAWGLPDAVVFSFNAKAYKLPKGLTFEYEKSGQPQATAPKDTPGKIKLTYTDYKVNKGLSTALFKK